MTFDARPEVMALRDRHGWRLPYSAAAVCIRGFAVAEGGRRSIRVYAAAEVGGVLVSDDGGQSWQNINPSYSNLFLHHLPKGLLRHKSGIGNSFRKASITAVGPSLREGVWGAVPVDGRL